MRAELPWNVAGIPSEAREAARAAARREGLSVGEWLTRRILRSFSDLDEEEAPAATPYDRSFERAAPPDPWGLSAGRRDSEEMPSRVSRSEEESSESWRRIAEHLRSVTRRLDSAERSQTENNRAMSRAAGQIGIATREQAQAFDQLGGHVMSIEERLERLEHGAAQDGLKDAVNALHQGLSRLADQITQTATHSAQQVTSISGNLEQLAGRLDQMRADIEATARRTDSRISAVEEEARNRFTAVEAQTARTLEQRPAVEKLSHFDTDALGHALERLEAQDGVRAGDQAALQKRLAGIDGAIGGLQENLEALQADPAIEYRLDSVERALGNLAARLEAHEPATGQEDRLRILSRRIETVEKQHGELLDELRADPAGGGPAEPSYDPAIFASKPFASPEIETPPFAEPPQPFGGETPPKNDQDSFADDAFAADAVTPPPADGAAEPTLDDNFLAIARRSARAAAEAEANRGSRLGFALRSRSAPGAQTSPYLVPAIIAAILILALVSGVMLSERMGRGSPAAVAATPVPHTAPGNAPFAQAPENLSPANNQAPNLLPEPQAVARPAPAPARAPTLDRVIQLANGGNASAETIIGLKELDGDGVPADPADGAKWLERAAGQGEAVAQYRLGTAYERGQGVTANPATATHWYQLAASQGNRKAMHNLAVAYAGGLAGKTDMAEAARWFAKAAALGLTDSQFNLAALYERGEGVSQSLPDAYKWYAIAASQGDAESKSRLTVLGSQLSDNDRTAAQKSAAGFRADALNQTANVPPEMADLAAN